MKNIFKEKLCLVASLFMLSASLSAQSPNKPPTQFKYLSFEHAEISADSALINDDVRFELVK